MNGLLGSTLAIISHYGLLGIFTSMAIENMAVPFPTEGAFLISQHLITAHLYSFWFMFWLIVAGQLFGSMLSYWIGRALRELAEKYLARNKGFKETEGKLTRWYETYGSIAVFATRLIGYVRPWSSLVAGLADFPFWPFVLWTFLGTLIFVYPTMHITGLLVLVWQRYPDTHILISLGAFVLFFGVMIYKIIHTARKRRKAS
jgi:membrane protein DedA with SNARE-associated domain